MKFSTADYCPKDQFEVWRAFHAPLVETKRAEHDQRQHGYRASVEMRDFGTMRLAMFDMEGISFQRSAKLVRQSGIDHCWISVMKSGSVRTRTASRSLKVSGGAVFLHSLGTAFVGAMETSRFNCFMLDRDDFPDLADELDRSFQWLVQGPMGHILAEFIHAVEAQIGVLNAAEAPAVCDAFASLLRATLRASSEAAEVAGKAISASQYDMARRHIRDNLKSPELTPDFLCAKLGVSRRQLYALFEHHGGVVRFIRQKRLAACYTALGTKSEKKLISSVAYEYGFTNLASFYRQFHAQYGFKPSEARAAMLSGFDPKPQSARTFGDWLLRVSED